MTLKSRPRILLLFPAALLLILSACNRDAATSWQGYAEGEYVYVAAPRGGRLLELAVRKGENVSVNAPLFRLDPEPEATAVAEAQRRLEQAGFRRDDLGSGERPSEIAALQAQRDQARAARDLAQRELLRQESLYAENVTSRELLDRSRAAAQQTAALVAELDARLTTARLGGRIGQRQALSAEAAALSEALRQAEWQLSQKSPTAPQGGLVFDTLFEVGELVPAGTPVVILLPETGRKARFYVPEPQLASLHTGDKVMLRFDGGELPATISYISPQAEYTPPVIYSRDSRAKLVYLIEARPDAVDAARLKPGQPLEVTPQ
ncbi:MAG: HlyD family efflux transporter periplasmic adaptor subunit [Desulfuromonadales bacterium]|nr:HlyD family efflux transporter periplasmic adaptor subunit [Desulfuromonadales bacterium]